MDRAITEARIKIATRAGDRWVFAWVCGVWAVHASHLDDDFARITHVPSGGCIPTTVTPQALGRTWRTLA